MQTFNGRGLCALFLAGLMALPVAADPRHGGGGGDWGPGRSGGHDGFFDPGPRHGHGLPGGAREMWLGSMLYFVAAGTYYLWNADRKQYVVVEAPPAARSSDTGIARYDVIAYPAAGQTSDQQARDRYECHSWAVSQSGFDPATAQSAPDYGVAETYRRAIGACLSGRGYSVN